MGIVISGFDAGQVFHADGIGRAGVEQEPSRPEEPGRILDV